MSTTIRQISVPYRRPLTIRIRTLISTNIDAFGPATVSRRSPGSHR